MTLFFDGEMITPLSGTPQMNVPISAIVITLSFFMTLILVLYFWILRHENSLQKEMKGEQMDHFIVEEDLSDYSQKLKYLDTQDIQVTTFQ